MLKPIRWRRRWRSPSCPPASCLHGATDATTRCAGRFAKSPPIDSTSCSPAVADIRSESFGELPGEKQRIGRAQGIRRAHRVGDFNFKLVAVFDQRMIDAQTIEHWK